MEKTKPSVLRQLDGDYERACNGYLVELARLWGIDLMHGYWIDGPGSVYDFDGSWTLGMEDILYIVRHGITMEQAEDWREYVCWAGENDFDQPSLKEYVEASVPILDSEAQRRISEARIELLRLCNEERGKMLDSFLSRKNMTRHLKED